VLGSNDRSNRKVIEIPADIRTMMIEHSMAELPNEACGLLAGTDGRVERFYAVRNQDESPKTYRLDGREHLLAQKDMEERGWEVIGVFHSHTQSDAYPSATDRRRAFWPDPESGLPIYPGARYVIASLTDRDRPLFRAFLIKDADTVEEQEVRTV
jgi:proteasome lid subunit RPN8/RPN11